MFYVVVWLFCAKKEQKTSITKWFWESAVQGNWKLWAKKSREITQATTTPADPEQSLDQWCFNAGHCPHVFYFPVVLCSRGTSCSSGLNLQRNSRALSQIKGQEQPVLSVGFGRCVTWSETHQDPPVEMPLEISLNGGGKKWRFAVYYQQKP